MKPFRMIITVPMRDLYEWTKQGFRVLRMRPICGVMWAVLFWPEHPRDEGPIK